MGEVLPPRIKYWINTKEKHDCFFLVGPEDETMERIGAIKILLMGDCEPFRIMLGDGELAESGDIRVKDVEPETFKSFLTCVYGASSVIIPKLAFEESAKLLYVFEKYLVLHLKNELLRHMRELVTYENVSVAFSYPVCYQTSLKFKMQEIIKYDFDKIVQNENFLELSDVALSRILQQECILVKEIEIWNSVLKWAKHKTNSDEEKNLRSHIFDLLKYIRFMSMDFTEFRESVLSSEILSEEEINDICKSFVLDKPCSIEHLCKDGSSRYNIRRVSPNIKSSVIVYTKTVFIHFEIDSISEFQNNINCFSKTYPWAGHFWCITVRKENDKEVDNLGVFVYCNGKTSDWSCKAEVELSLINHSGKPDSSRMYTQTFNPSENDWGFKSFYNWNQLTDPTSGFVIDNRIVLDARIKTCA